MNEHTKKLAESFGKSLNDHRRAHDLSARDVGALLGVHDSSISNWERGEFLPSRPNYESLVALFPELKDDEVALAITCEVKPGGAPITPSSHGKGAHSSPKFKPIRKSRKGRNKMEAALFPKKREPAPPKKREPALEVPQDPEKGDAFELFGHVLFEVYGRKILKPLISDRTNRAALIYALRDAGVPESAIVDIIHEGLG